MKSLRLLVALSTLMVAGYICPVQAQVYGGQVLLPQAGRLAVPIGVNETGRYARFVSDARFEENQIQLSNRDFQNWKPLDARSKEKMMHYMRGSLRSGPWAPPDQETGRFMRFVVDPRMDFNNVITENRDFQNFKVNGSESRYYMRHYLRGLPVGHPNPLLMQPRSVAVNGQYLPLGWY